MSFNLSEFLPYQLNQAAEAVGKEFQNHYRDKYGMLRTEWRVLFHVGNHDDMTAKRICEMASIHKTKASRAIAALEKKRFLQRTTDDNDRRSEYLRLTRNGLRVFEDLRKVAAEYQAKITNDLTKSEMHQLSNVLSKLAKAGS